MALTAIKPNRERLFVGRNRAAELVDLSTRMLDEAIKAGDLEAYRVGRKILIRRDALIRFVERVRARQAHVAEEASVSEGSAVV